MNINSIAFIDFETRSKIDLKKHGTDIYAKDPSTKILCMAYAIGIKPAKIWTLGQPFPADLLLPDIFVGHNIGGFEWCLWQSAAPKDWPDLKIEQCADTMAMARTMGLPGSLDGAAAAAGIEIKKDPLGYRVMMQLSKPNKDGVFIEPEDEPVKFKMLYDYCKQDVEVTRALYNRLLPLTKKEKRVWVLDQEINQRGVGIDVHTARNMNAAVAAKQAELNTEIRRLTGDGVLSYNASAQLKKWLSSQGVDKESVAKAEVAEMLNNINIPEHVKEVLKIRQEAAKSSTAKIESMLNHQSEGRARNLFAYHGANTGRWAGRDIQLQNMARGNLSDDDVEFALKCFNEPKLTPAIDMTFGSVMTTASSCLRSLLVPAKGHKFLCADYSNIEGRVLAWIAQEEWKVRAFKDFDQGIGHDLYLLTYSRAFGVPIEKVTKDQRQIGKVLELACGFGGGVGAFQNMARMFGVEVSDDRADELKVAWREANVKISKLWYDLENAAIWAVRNPGKQKEVTQHKIIFQTKGSFLLCTMPSGRTLYYPYPEIHPKETPWGEVKDQLTYMTQDSLTKKWGRCSTYGGSLTENITQALARDVLAEGMLRVTDAGYPIVMHVHDEIVCEVPIDSNLHSLEEFEKLMGTPPDWASDMPIATSGWEGVRYKK